MPGALARDIPLEDKEGYVGVVLLPGCVGTASAGRVGREISGAPWSECDFEGDPNVVRLANEGFVAAWVHDFGVPWVENQYGVGIVRPE